MRALIAAVLSLPLVAALPAGAQTAPGIATPAAAVLEPAARPEAAADTPGDLALALGAIETRMTVPVSIGEHGPWPFIIDTGAERTVVSRQLATSLDLAAGPPLRVIAMAGVSAASSVIVPALGVSTLPRPTITAPALDGRNMGAVGILGIDALQQHSVDIDFDKAAMTVHPSRKHRAIASARGDEIVVVARSLYGQLIVTDAHWRGRRIAVVIDTGSTMTIGNPALLAMMARRARSLGPTSALSVTGATLAAQVYEVDGLAIGHVGFDNVPVAIADAAPFRRFGLEKRPALMLGMDTLRLFRRVRIDFANRDIQFTLPRGQGRQIGLPDGWSPG